MEEIRKLDELKVQIANLLLSIEGMPNSTKEEIKRDIYFKYSKVLGELTDTLRRYGIGIDLDDKFGLEEKEVNGNIDNVCKSTLEDKRNEIYDIINRLQNDKEQTLQEESTQIDYQGNKQVSEAIKQVILDDKADKNNVYLIVNEITGAMRESSKKVSMLLEMERLPVSIQEDFIMNVTYIIKQADSKYGNIEEGLKEQKGEIAERINMLCEEYMELEEKDEEKNFRDRMSANISLDEQHNFVEQWKKDNEGKEEENPNRISSHLIE